MDSPNIIIRKSKQRQNYINDKNKDTAKLNNAKEWTQIYIKLNGHNYINEIEEVVRLFYSNMNFETVNEEPPQNFGAVLLYTGIVLEGSKLYLRVCLYNYGKSIFENQVLVSDEISFDSFSNEDNGPNFTASISREKKQLQNNHSIRRILKRELKRSVYKSLKELTGKTLPWGMLTGIRPAKIVHEMINSGASEKKIIDRLTGYYGVSRKKAELAYNVAIVEKSILDKTDKNTVGIYIGIPFCPTRCIYCSFTSNPIDRYKNYVNPYLEALYKEIRLVAKLIEDMSFKIQTIYIGGGTPTSVSSKELKELLAFIDKEFSIDQVEEYSLEAGRPDSIDEDKLDVIRNSAITRISINPQSMNEKTLKVIGRSHTPEDIVRIFKLARRKGFNNINMDIIAGLPGENLDMFKYTLKKIGELNPENLTVHTMSVKRASRLNEQLDEFSLFDKGKLVASMIDEAGHFAKISGMHPYYLYRQKKILGNQENIGYCKPGFECIYNVQIMEEQQTIIALGAGGTTKVVFPDGHRIERAFNVKNVEEYINRVEEMVKRKENLLNLAFR